MSEREYTPCEKRVCEYLQRLTRNQIGCGDDPIGFLIASHSWLHSDRLNTRLLPVEADQCVKPNEEKLGEQPVKPMKVSDFNP